MAEIHRLFIDGGKGEGAIVPRLFKRPTWREYARAALESRVPAGRFDNGAIHEYLEEAFTRRGRTDDFRRLSRSLPRRHRPGHRGERELRAAGPRHRSISRAVQASAALPGLFPLVQIDGRSYVDGALKKTVHACSQRISVVKALSQGYGGKIRAALEAALKLQPKHAEAHISMGAYHAEIIDKAAGALVGGLTYGANAKEGEKHFRRALELAPDSPIARIEMANGLVKMHGRRMVEEPGASTPRRRRWSRATPWSRSTWKPPGRSLHDSVVARALRRPAKSAFRE